MALSWGNVVDVPSRRRRPALGGGGTWPPGKTSDPGPRLSGAARGQPYRISIRSSLFRWRWSWNRA